MTCEALINKFLMDYHAGTLPRARKLEFDVHLALCRDCRKYVDAYKKTVVLAKGSTALPGPPPDKLIDAILRATQSDKPD